MKKPIRIVLAGIVVIAGAVALVVAIRPSGSEARFNPHAETPFAPGELDRVLRAASDFTAATSHADLVARGRALFRSTTLTKRGLSCLACHAEGAASPALGTIIHAPSPSNPTDFIGPRDPITLWGEAKTAPYGWNGQQPSLEAFVTRVVKNFFLDGSAPPERIAALSAYLRSLTPPVSSFDLGTMSAAALRGQELFQGKAGCIGCHIGSLFTDNRLHNILVPQVANPDGTLGNDPGAPAPPGAFNTPALRDVVNTAPYFHNGFAKSLHDLVVFYSTQSVIAPLGLTGAEIDDLVAYLEAL